MKELLLRLEVHPAATMAVSVGLGNAASFVTGVQTEP